MTTKNKKSKVLKGLKSGKTITEIANEMGMSYGNTHKYYSDLKKEGHTFDSVRKVVFKNGRPSKKTKEVVINEPKKSVIIPSDNLRIKVGGITLEIDNTMTKHVLLTSDNTLIIK